MDIRLALLVSGLTGFLALSYEILWFRVYGYLTGGAPGSFAVVLGVYLLGIALGSLAVRPACQTGQAGDQPQRLALPAGLVLAGTLLGWALIPGVAEAMRTQPFAKTLPFVALVAGLLGAVLPLVAHYGIAPDERAGERLSWLYLANIAGSTLGSLTTGFVLMQHLSLAQIALVLGLGGLGLVLILAWAATVQRQRSRLLWLASLLALAVGLVVTTPKAYDFVYEKLLYKQNWEPGERFAHTVENRSGVINVSAAGRVYGSGMYDGVFNTELTHDSNMIVRAYALGGMRPKYDDVLMIGLSSGSWAQVIAANPQVGHLTVVEINPGYPQIAAQFPSVAGILTNPKVTLVFDDGRRWLKAHADRKFDLVVQNTTWHWRGHITNLLSGEYLELVKQHLKTGGIFYFNTTSSIPAQKTACAHFKNGFRYWNFVAVSDAPLSIDAELWRQALTQPVPGGKPVLDTQVPAEAAILREALRQAPFTTAGGPNDPAQTCASILRENLYAPLVSDDNMVTEWQRAWDEQPLGGD